jgi:DNA-binding response OmpR family regulator
MINNNYDAIVLDINLPVMNGKEFLKILRSS